MTNKISYKYSITIHGDGYEDVWCYRADQCHQLSVDMEKLRSKGRKFTLETL